MSVGGDVRGGGEHAGRTLCAAVEELGAFPEEFLRDFGHLGELVRHGGGGGKISRSEVGVKSVGVVAA